MKVATFNQSIAPIFKMYSLKDTIEVKDFALYSEVSLAQGLVIDHTPPTIVVSYDEARLLMKRLLIRDLLISSS